MQGVRKRSVPLKVCCLGCQTNSIHERNWYFRCAGVGECMQTSAVIGTNLVLKMVFSSQCCAKHSCCVKLY